MRLDCSCREQGAILNNRWIEAGSLGIFTRVTGAVESAPPLVLVHGQVVSSRYMVPLMGQLAGDFAVYAPDLPGFGKSAKPRHTLNISQLADSLAAWMKAIGLDRAAFLGNSFGCQIIVEFAIRHSGRVSRAVLQGPTVDPEARTIHQQVARWMLDGTREPLSFGFIMAYDYLAAGMRRSWETFHHLLRDRFEEKLPYMEVPTLVVRGSRDPIVPQRWASEVAQRLPSGCLCVIRGAPHAINYTAPVELARVIRPFLQKDSSSFASS